MKYALPALLLIVVGLLVFRLVGNKKEAEPVQMEMPVGVRTVKVQEVIQTTSYTYLEVKEKNQVYWVAVNKMEAEKGDTYAYQTALQMDDFESPELGRTFDVIYFIQDLFKTDPKTGNPIPIDHQTNKPRTEQVENLSIEKVEGAITVAEAFKNSKDLSGKKVVITGKVVKVNNMVMNRNWIHIQDGTSHDNSYDLTITSIEEVNEGDTVTFEGVLNTERDFGAGYFYQVIIEDATVIQQ